MLDFTLEPRATHEMLGPIPMFLSELDPRPAYVQLHENCAFNRGWQPFNGFTLNADNSISPADNPRHPLLAQAKLRDEIIRIYPYA